MDTNFVPTADVITNACMYLKKSEYEATEKSLNDAIDNIAELIADNDLPRDDDALADLSQAKQLMTKARIILYTYINVTV